ncbi:rhodanese domain-containing protein [Herminiimonas sp.]|uniref:oxygen-dependent tRNA uridine(34) hydroxylase TrhO n=1 Tax=Herminiimonas sp. TaxID=1926289 RepID=UPI002727F302|nr:rhodanese-like domain-containing protein [Herminiimonas sp.]MDO8304487.1 rhodanese-like domain-containing protein [Herminiimonas sp.]
MNLSPSQAAEPLLHTAFYKFAALADPDAVVTRLRELTHDLLGSILVAEEGINGVLAGTRAAVDAFEQALRTDAVFDGKFADIAFKRSACKTSPFARMKVHRKSEIVYLGVDDVDAVSKTGIDVSPQEWRELIVQDDVVVIDNRNSFEYKLGKFRNAIDPGVDNFRDFSAYIEEHVPQWQSEGKRVAMYCTGGIRCEKTSAWMLDMGVPVYQLEGGVLNYFQAMPDAEKDWEGECFVFDNRIALDTKLQETGTTLEDVYGGVPEWEWRLQRARRLDEDSE